MRTTAMPNGKYVPLAELIANAEEELYRQKYSSGSIANYTCVWEKLLNYAQNQDVLYFSETLGQTFLKDVYGFFPEKTINENPHGYKHKRRAIRILGDLQLHGIILRHEMSDVVPFPPQFEYTAMEYIKYLNSQYLSEATIKTKIPQIKRFLCFLNEFNVEKVDELTSEHINAFSKTICGYHVKTYNGIMVTIRQFLKYLYIKGIVDEDFSSYIVLGKVYRYSEIPSAFTSEEIEKILSSIDRSSRTGKRDYAVILLAVKLGIRAGDIRNLQLTDINWCTNEISFVQSKTRIEVTLPLDSETGWAIIDYLQHARPKCESRNVFVRFKAPYVPYSPKNTFYNEMKKYISKAGVTKDIPHKKGLHSLRHSLASLLLEENTPLPIISGVLGHSDYNSTMIYLKSDIKNLRQCIIDPEEVIFNENENSFD